MLNDNQRAFIETSRAAAMTTLRRDGSPHTVRVAVTVIDGRVWSSGTADRLRTKHLRRDPRATLMVFDPGFAYLTLECRVNIIEGPTVPELSVRLFETMQRGMTPAPKPGTLVWYGQEKSREEFLRLMVEERRLIYEFEPLRVYGIHPPPA